MATIVFIGDSITKGTDYGGVTNEDTFAYKIGIASGYSASDIINHGVSSDTSAGVLGRLQQDVIDLLPDVCSVMIGTNDWKTSITSVKFCENMDGIIQRLKNSGIKPVVFSPVMYRGTNAQFASWRPYLEGLEDICVSNGVDFIDVYREFTYMTYSSVPDAWKLNYVDQTHLTKSGHNTVANFTMRPCHASKFIR